MSGRMKIMTKSKSNGTTTAPKITEVAPDPEVPVPTIEFNCGKENRSNDPLLNSEESPIFNVDPNAFKGLQSSYDRVRLFDSPFAHIVNNNKVDKYCSHCLRLPEEGSELQHCGACAFAKYCSKDCQKLAWKMHRSECRRLNAVFPNLPLTEVLFLSRCIDKVIFLEEFGDKFGWEKARKWETVMGHEDEIREDKEKMAHFEKVFTKMSAFRKEEMIDKDKFYTIFCKITINSHSVHTNGGDEIGMSMDLGVSMYDHSCRPNCTMVFDGYRVFLRPLSQEISPYDTKRSFISYIDVGRSRYQRRQELKAKWYFDCNCDRCKDPEDDILTSIQCANKACDEPLITSEDAGPMMIACPKCKTIASEEYVVAAQELMKSLPIRFDPKTPLEEVEKHLKRAQTMLHQQNIYINRMQTTICHITGNLQNQAFSMQKIVYENYKRCFPAMDRHNGFQLINIVRSLIEAGDRKTAVPYSFDAMSIFEVCFGMDHPYYLQTLALWTFLEKEIPKDDEELLKLTVFGDNRPVNIGAFLGTNAIPGYKPDA